jgi:hypothetical protein
MDRLMSCGEVPSDAEFIENYIAKKGKGKSWETIRSELENRQIDWDDEEVVELVEGLFPEK